MISKNKPALDSFNVLKAFVLLGLPFVHVVEMYFTLGIITDSLHSVALFIVTLTMFGPGVFMICMGLGLAKSKSPARIRKLGIQMIIISLILNILRSCIGDLLLIFTGELTVLRIIGDLLCGDIYMFVGLFLIAYSLLKQCKLSSTWIMVIAVVAVIIDTLCSSNIYLESSCLSVFLGNFISCSSASFFPLLGWFIFPCIGIAMEECIISLEAKRRMKRFALVAICSLVCCVVSVVLAEVCGKGLLTSIVNSVGYCIRSFDSVLMQISWSMFLTSFYYIIYQIIPANRIEGFFLRLSSLLFPFFILQWVFVALASWYLPIILQICGITLILDTAMYFILSASILAISLFCTIKWGFSISRWIFKKSDYAKWFKRGRRSCAR